MAQGAQLENVIFVKTETDEFVLKGRPCEVSANAFVPPSRPNDKERNAFNMDRTVSAYSSFEMDTVCYIITLLLLETILDKKYH